MKTVKEQRSAKRPKDPNRKVVTTRVEEGLLQMVGAIASLAGLNIDEAWDLFAPAVLAELNRRTALAAEHTQK